jgi:hypothetical protein
MQHGFIRRAFAGEAIATFAIKTTAGGNYFFKLVDASGKEHVDVWKAPNIFQAER